MDKTKSKLAAFFENEEEESFPAKHVDDAKISQYTNAKVRKSKREKEQEAQDARKKEEEVNAAQAYAEFLDAFEGPEERAPRMPRNTFVRADTKVVYTPAAPDAGAAGTHERRHRSPSPVATPAPKPKGKRAMDSFLEEIKREQAEREMKYARQGGGRSVTAMAAFEGLSGSKDRGDPLTSNLFVANLPPQVTEQSLGILFARAGPVNSVKIMWPRADGSVGPGADMTASRRVKNTGLNGFVSFMTRQGAEEALQQFEGFEWGGSVLRVGWSKAVPISNKPLYVSNIRRSKSRSRSRERNVRDRSKDKHRSRHSRSRSHERHRSRSPRMAGTRRYSRSRSPGRSRSPYAGLDDEEDGVTDTFIKAVAGQVKGHDAEYESALKKWEKDNSKYAFLLQRTHRRHAYYRGLVESTELNSQAFDDEGYNSVYSTDSGEESERERTRKTSLGPLAKKRFEAMLRALSGKRGDIARCAAFSLEHAEAAPEVADIIVSSLLNDQTAVPRKVARLHLICDILHNSAAPLPSAWKYRQEFQSRLGIVFDHLASIYHSFPGRITGDVFKKQITTIIDVWESWIVFPMEFTTELRTRLEGAPLEAGQTPMEDVVVPSKQVPTVPTSKFKVAGFKPATEPVHIAPAGDEGEPMEVSDDEGAKEDLDGEPIDDLDGEPVDDIDGEPVDELMGKPTDEAEDLDGEHVDDDLDGEPVDDDLDGEPVDDDLDGEPATI